MHYYFERCKSSLIADEKGSLTRSTSMNRLKRLRTILVHTILYYAIVALSHRHSFLLFNGDKLSIEGDKIKTEWIKREHTERERERKKFAAKTKRKHNKEECKFFSSWKYVVFISTERVWCKTCMSSTSISMHIYIPKTGHIEKSMRSCLFASSDSIDGGHW